jgi:hypothetical protein
MKTHTPDLWLYYSLSDGELVAMPSDEMESLLMEAASLYQFHPEITLRHISEKHHTEAESSIVMAQPELLAEARKRQRAILRRRVQIVETLNEPAPIEEWINPMTVILTVIALSMAVIIALVPR